MRTHVWRKQLTRLSQRGQRLPFQRRRAFHSITRQLEAYPSPNQETANHENAIPEAATKPAPSTRRGRLAQRRPKEVTPFIVPDWFLRHNVRLHSPSENATANKEPRCWTLVDRDSGHTVLTLPFSVNPSDQSNDFFTPSAQSKEEKTREPVPQSEEKDAVQDDVARAVSNHLSAPSALQTPDPRTLLSLQLQLLLHAAFSQTGPSAARYTKSNIDLNTRDFAHKELDVYVQQIADLVQADLIHLDANDIAELAQDYVERGDPVPGSISSLAYDTFKGATTRREDIKITMKDESAKDDGQDDGESEHAHDMPELDLGNLPMMGGSMGDLANFLQQNSQTMSQALARAHKHGAAVVMAEMPKSNNQSSEEARSRAAEISPWAELKLSTLLDTVMDSVQIRKDSSGEGAAREFFYEAIPSTPDTITSSPPTKDGLERFLADFLAKRIDSATQAHKMDWAFKKDSAPSQSSLSHQRTIIHVRDMDHIRNAPQGETIINLLVNAVQRRRKDGEQIVIVGTTANSNQAPPPPGEDDDDLHFRYLRYPSASSSTQNIASQLMLVSHNQQKLERSVAEPALQRLFEINMRHIHTMVRHLGLPVSKDFFSGPTRAHLNIPGTSRLGDRTLSQDEVQRVVLCADSLRSLYTTSSSLETSHIALAAMLVNTVDSVLEPPARSLSVNSVIPQARERGESQSESDGAKNSTPAKLDMEKLKKSCSKHETRLLSGVVDPASLRTTFNDVHADPNTIESLKTLTSLTLLRPEAFSYGVLAADRLPGLLLYGPPGTGKTLLAKAVAKESSATVLEVSGAQIYEKYVGEGEKMVNAVFSLAKKLSPCVVFIDEADALFGSRGGANNRTTHREIINQFLRGWDGMDDHSVFMMVATNRPFDLDDAVLRRLPRRLLVDLPLAKDREGILNIHLKGETLDPAVSLSDLAKNTPLYSGSDLKNLCVAAALAAVRDENNALEAARAKGDTEFKLPERRTLAPSHFEKGLQEISASVSEDMATLSAIRKFDEQYGEKRARTKKPGYGFGLGSSNAIDETGARVRPDEGSR
ncbi:AAA-domain-containing protein [Aureobasidium sp. EXF-10727]|nr:AAA-domain-containing protein [Aureobasidium sp. EXF-10727]